jgi:hypothetical protein
MEVDMRSALSLIALLLPAALARATDVCVADCNPATGTACNVLPLGASFTAGECRYQAIFTQAQMGAGGTITDLSLAICTGGVFAATTLEITMSHLTGAPSTTFAANLPSPVVVRNAASYIFSAVPGQWSRLRLECPFNYNGLDSLVVELRYQGGSNSAGNGALYRNEVATRVYAYGAGSYSAVAGSTDMAAFKIRFTKADTSITGGSPTPGGTVNLLFDASSDRGLGYFGASSLGAGPTPLGCWTLALTIDGLFLLSSSGSLPTIFVNFQGALSAAGQANPSINLPPIPSLTGLVIVTAFVTVDGAGLKTVAAPVRFVIQ